MPSLVAYSWKKLDLILIFWLKMKAGRGGGIFALLYSFNLPLGAGKPLL